MPILTFDFVFILDPVYWRKYNDMLSWLHFSAISKYYSQYSSKHAYMGPIWATYMGPIWGVQRGSAWVPYGLAHMQVAQMGPI